MTDTDTDIDDKDGIAAALVQLQSQALTVGKTATADTGAYSYSYATLADVHAVLLPAMAKVGLAFTVTVTGAAGGACEAVGELHHAPSGDRMETRWPLPPTTDPQKLGSAVTYARRYMLLAVTGTATGDDDDGAAAAGSSTSGQLPKQQHTYQELVDLCAAASDAGVTGEYDDLLDWAADRPEQRVDVAYGRVARAMGDHGVKVPS